MNRNGGACRVVGAGSGTDVRSGPRSQQNTRLAKNIGKVSILRFGYQPLSIWYSTQKGRSNEEIHSNEIAFMRTADPPLAAIARKTARWLRLVMTS